MNLGDNSKHAGALLIYLEPACFCTRAPDACCLLLSMVHRSPAREMDPDLVLLVIVLLHTCLELVWRVMLFGQKCRHLLPAAIYAALVSKYRIILP